MQYLQNFLNSKRLPIKDILSQYLQISIKIDGSSFQIYNDGNNIYYGKRYDKNTTPTSTSKQITIFDLLLHNAYYNAYYHLKQYEGITSKYKILNFEILGDNHILNYESKYLNNIVLLSGFNHDNSELSINALKSLSNDLHISCKENVYEGYLNATEIDYIINNKDNLDILWQFFKKLTNVDNNIEGLVLDFDYNNRILKLPQPDFQIKLISKLDDDKNNKDYNFENCYDFVIDNIDINKLNYNQDYIHILFEIYQILENTKNCKNISVCLEKNIILQCQTINNLILKQIYNSDIKYGNLMKFILLGFKNKRSKKPLWCSLEYQQTKLNTFINNIEVKLK